MTAVLVRRREETQTQMEDSHLEVEAETGVLLPQTKDRLEVPDAGGGKEVSFPRDFRKSMALPTA